MNNNIKSIVRYDNIKLDKMNINNARLNNIFFILVSGVLQIKLSCNVILSGKLYRLRIYIFNY